MLAGLEIPPAVEAERLITAALPDLHSGNHRGVVVHSPTAAGTSTLLVRAAVELAGAAKPLIVTAHKNEQGHHLIAAMLQKVSKHAIGRISAADARPRSESRFTRWSRAAPSGFRPRPCNGAVPLRDGELATRQVTPRVE